MNGLQTFKEQSVYKWDKWNTSFTHFQTNANLLNIYNNSITELSTGITHHCEEHINTLQQQYSAKSAKVNERPVSLVHKPLSGNKLIDDFIESTQTFHYGCVNNSRLEFIPYEQLTNIKYFAKGGFSIIYKATWVDGSITVWCHKKQRHNRKRNYDVVLKSLVILKRWNPIA
ncbi:10323_t:CDS:2 [Gigaspora margarita]|uniref:10323_t:CDS:1 n=1 Tax=Gigaspora margarita TaxID=4874 RepID=A0ABN7V890_GIGMA|nr:10323_t:CDS:2 [Gigaspora margarita]